MIQQTTTEGRDYFTATRRGVEYTAMRQGDAWGVASRRLALGRSNIGGFKHYPTIEAVEAGCKAFSGLSMLVNAPTVAA